MAAKCAEGPAIVLGEQRLRPIGGAIFAVGRGLFQLHERPEHQRDAPANDALGGGQRVADAVENEAQLEFVGEAEGVADVVLAPGYALYIIFLPAFTAARSGGRFGITHAELQPFFGGGSLFGWSVQCV